MKKILEINNLSKSYGKQKIFTSLNWSLDPHGIHGIMGPSGSGKTTLLKMVSGLEKADEGVIKINERVVNSRHDHVPPHTRNIGFVFQEATLWPHMTMLENIQFALHPSYETTYEEILSRMGITHVMHKYPDEISEGEGKRVSIARAICSGATLLLMDEPYANLDKAIKLELMDLVKAIQIQMNLTVIFVSHDETEHAYHSDRVHRIKDGKIYEEV